MPLENGTYHIAMYFGSDKKYVDLTESNTAPNTPIIGYTPDDSKLNQKWVLEVRDDGKIGSIRSLLSDFAYCATTGESSGDKLVVGERQFYELVPKNDKYRIKHRGENIVWRLPSPDDRTQIELQPPGLGYDEWSFTKVFSK